MDNVTLDLDGQSSVLVPLDELSLAEIVEAEDAGYPLDDETRSEIGEVAVMLWLMARRHQPDETVATIAARVKVKDVERIAEAIGKLSGKAQAAAEKD